MLQQHLIRLIGVVWVLIAAGVFFVADAETFRRWLLLAMAGGIPPIILLATELAEPVTVARGAHPAEGRP